MTASEQRPSEQDIATYCEVAARALREGVHLPLPPEGAADALRALVVLADDQALVDHLLELNESGVHPIAVGIDANHQPFLITLTEPDLHEHVFFDSPWQTDIDWTTGETYCDECTGHLHGIEDIKFPVTIMRSTQPVLHP